MRPLSGNRFGRNVQLIFPDAVRKRARVNHVLKNVYHGIRIVPENIVQEAYDAMKATLFSRTDI